LKVNKNLCTLKDNRIVTCVKVKKVIILFFCHYVFLNPAPIIRSLMMPQITEDISFFSNAIALDGEFYTLDIVKNYAILTETVR